MQIASFALALLSIISPTKSWFPPTQPVEVSVNPAGGEVQLVLTDLQGNPQGNPAGPYAAQTNVNLREAFAPLTSAGTYVVYEVPAGKTVKETVSTPWVITNHVDSRRGAPPGVMVTSVRPLQYAEMQTDAGPINMLFYYDVAPNTVRSFIDLAKGGYFDGLNFHRVVPRFVIQGGDPRGNGTGGPGYYIDAEFNTRPHVVGALSMARSGDPREGQGMMPSSDYANSAGSQFFIVLDRNTAAQLDRKYTVFGKVFSGMSTVNTIGQSPLADPQTGRPQTPTVIKSVKVVDVTAENNPYLGVDFNADAPAQ